MNSSRSDSDSLTYQNSFNGQAEKSGCDGCNRLERECSLDDWNNDSIGLLTDDDIFTDAAVANENRSKEVDTDGPTTQTNSINNEKAKEGKKPRPKLQHNLSWHSALKKAKCLPDPWEKFHIDDSCPTEVAIRHRYNALKKSWVQDEVRVKMEALVSLNSISYEILYGWFICNIDCHCKWEDPVAGLSFKECKP